MVGGGSDSIAVRPVVGRYSGSSKFDPEAPQVEGVAWRSKAPSSNGPKNIVKRSLTGEWT